MTNRRFDGRGLLLLIATAVLMLFANGRWGVAAVTWIAPALLVRFVRTQPFGRALAGGIVVLSAANFVWWYGVFPLSGAPYAIASIVLGTVTLVPYLLDRRFAARLGGLAGTLVLPSAAVTIETVNAFFSPYGSWGSFAYSQAANLPLLQIVSLTGLCGVTFLVLWLSTIVNTGPAIRRNAIVYASVLAAAFLFGTLRLRSAAAGDTVSLAAITPRIPTYTVRGEDANRVVHEALSSVRKRRQLTAAQWQSFRERAAAINDELLRASEREARAGAKIVVWSEGAGIVEKQDEAGLIARGAEVARRSGTWIELSFLTLDRRGSTTFENKNVLVDSAGAIAWTYQKAHPVPGMEACVPGDGRVPVVTTPFARVATVICYDTDFPTLVRQAGVAGADILLVPADDWREIAPMHASMARFRAIEQGFSIVRATSNGFSTSIDRYGRVSASGDYFAGARSMSATVPQRGAPTLYRQVGDAGGWSALVLLAVLLVTATLKKVALPYGVASLSPADQQSTAP
jgi:apolipoprotein N-acyltransferase